MYLDATSLGLLARVRVKARLRDGVVLYIPRTLTATSSTSLLLPGTFHQASETSADFPTPSRCHECRKCVQEMCAGDVCRRCVQEMCAGDVCRRCVQAIAPPHT